MMDIKRIFLLLILFVTSPLVGRSQESLFNEFEQRLEAVSTKNNTIVARFNQIKSIPGLTNEVVKSGDFYYDNSGKMAMIYDEPKGDKVVMDGENFTIIVGGKRIESSASNPMMAQISYMMQASMSGDVGKLGRGWDPKIELRDGEYLVVLTPQERRIQRYVTSMTMSFDAVDMTLNSLRIDENRGGFTIYEYVSKEINIDIDNAIFIP